MNASAKPYLLPTHTPLHEPKLRFGSSDLAAVDVHPLRGLVEYGPFSANRLAGVVDPIRVALIGQDAMIDRLSNLLEELERPHEPKERRPYLPKYSGFSQIFGTRIIRAPAAANVVLPEALNDMVAKAEQPHTVLAEALTGAITSLRAQRHAFDVVLVGLDARWESGFKETRTEDFDLHDYIKAIGASSGLCIQIVRSDRGLSYHCRCSVMWRLGIALYTKAGGIPWALANSAPDTAFIGIDYALRPNSEDGARFAICCAQVFDADGAGLDFIAYEADGVKLFGRNPYLRRDQMLKVMARSLAIYQRKHAGSVPKRVVVHKNTPFRREEVDGCLDALSAVDNVELIQVQEESGWRGIMFAQTRSADKYPVARGLVLPLGPYAALLWSQGNLPEVANGKPYYKEGKGTPTPLLITRYAGRGDFYELCRDTLALTKMDWNNDGPYDRLPVTLGYAERLAQIVKRMPKLESHPYPVRLFM